MGRTSHEVRGLKFEESAEEKERKRSHLTRGAWIEIPKVTVGDRYADCRTSHEVRGLKYPYACQYEPLKESHLTRGAWIEINFRPEIISALFQSHLTRGAWIEIRKLCYKGLSRWSHLTRGAWIEILKIWRI